MPAGRSAFFSAGATTIVSVNVRYARRACIVISSLSRTVTIGGLSAVADSAAGNATVAMKIRAGATRVRKVKGTAPYSESPPRHGATFNAQLSGKGTQLER